MRACKTPPSIYCIFTVVVLFVCLLLFTAFGMTTSVSSQQFATDTKQSGLHVGHVIQEPVQDVCMLITLCF